MPEHNTGNMGGNEINSCMIETSVLLRYYEIGTSNNTLCVK